eukprot:1333055-Rhodomonas_salina.1
MSHARHTAATITASADSLWPIPNWRVLIAAITEAANGSLTAEATPQRSSAVRAEEAAVGHFEAQRSSLVVGLAALEVALRLVHAHLATHHMLLMAHYYLTPPRWPAAKTCAVDAKSLTIAKGRHALALEVSAPSTDARAPSKLELKSLRARGTQVKVDPKAPPTGVISDGACRSIPRLRVCVWAAKVFICADASVCWRGHVCIFSRRRHKCVSLCMSTRVRVLSGEHGAGRGRDFPAVSLQLHHRHRPLRSQQ